MYFFFKKTSLYALASPLFLSPNNIRYRLQLDTYRKSKGQILAAETRWIACQNWDHSTVLFALVIPHSATFINHKSGRKNVPFPTSRRKRNARGPKDTNCTVICLFTVGYIECLMWLTFLLFLFSLVLVCMFPCFIFIFILNFNLFIIIIFLFLSLFLLLLLLLLLYLFLFLLLLLWVHICACVRV